MGALLSAIASKRLNKIDEQYLSGELLEFTIENEGEFEALNFTGDRYLDMGIIYANMQESDKNSYPFNKDPYPVLYEIDKAAIYLAYCAQEQGDNGMYMLHCHLRTVLSDLIVKVLNDNNENLHNDVLLEDESTYGIKEG